MAHGTVHRVLAWEGTAVIIEQSLEMLAFYTAGWHATAQLLYGWLHT